MTHYCSYFDHRYLARFLVLYNSMMRHCSAFTMHALALTKLAEQALDELKLANLNVITLDDLYEFEPRLLEAGRNRSLVEFYFTCTPVLPLLVLSRHPEMETITYVDADMEFQASPSSLRDSMGKASIVITPHHFPNELQHYETRGNYNVGWIMFRQDDQGIACLERWRDDCLEWCYDRVEDGKYADQKYLDAWPDRYDRCQVLDHPGVNMGPWSMFCQQLEARPDGLFIGAQPLILFHFHGVRRLGPGHYDTGSRHYHHKVNGPLRDQVYVPYVRKLCECTRMLQEICPESLSLPARQGHLGRLTPWIAHLVLPRIRWWVDRLTGGSSFYIKLNYREST